MKDEEADSDDEKYTPNKNSKHIEEIGEREKWKDPFDFFVSCLGYAVGLGNIWRFPFLCYEHGGGSFLIPYFIMLLFAGLPILTLEMALGQYSSAGPVKTFTLISPVLKGLGYAMVSVGMLFSFFYIVVISWAVWFLLASFNPDLEWSNCKNDYNSEYCYTTTTGNNTSIKMLMEKHSASEEYWINNVLGSKNHTWSNFGYPRWRAIGTLLISWTIVALCLVKGIRASGKVVYFTSFFPYIILTALAIRSLTMPGALEGVKYFITPQWHHLTKFDVWTDAATQIIFSLGPGCGCIITLSSFNVKNRNCFRDAFMVSVGNSMTSIFCGVVVFAMLGFKANESDIHISKVVQGGPGLAFIVYPEIVTNMAAPNVWSFLFFAMLILLALGSIFAAFETVISALSDQFPTLQLRHGTLVIGISVILFVLGLPFTCGGGIHLFTVFNYAAPSWNLLLFTLLEVVCVGWIYSAEKILDDFVKIFKVSLSKFTRIYMIICWKFITPLILLILLAMSFANLGHIYYEDYVYPLGVQIFGNVVTGCTVIWIPVFALIEIRKRWDLVSSAELTSLMPVLPPTNPELEKSPEQEANVAK